MALPTYKDIVDLLKKGATIEAQEKIMELREAALEIQNENLILKQQIASLTAAQNLQDRLTYKKPFYEAKDNQNDKFCQRCYDVDRKAVRLQQVEPKYWRCIQCRNDFTEDGYDPSDPHDTDYTGRSPVTGY